MCQYTYDSKTRGIFMLRIDSYNDDTYDYICSIVSAFLSTAETFVSKMESVRRTLTKWIQKDDNLSQNPKVTVPNVRLLTTKGTVDLYFYADASDPDIPDAPSFYLYREYYNKDIESCLLFAVDGEFCCNIPFDPHSVAEVIEAVIPDFSLRIYNALL